MRSPTSIRPSIPCSTRGWRRNPIRTWPSRPAAFTGKRSDGIGAADVGPCETPPENFEQMREAHAAAFPDLDEALARHATLVAVHRALIRVAKANGAPPELRRQLLDRALIACPECFQVRVTFMFALQPRWGGDYAQMRRVRQRVDQRGDEHEAAPARRLRRCGSLQHAPALRGASRRPRRLQPRARGGRIARFLPATGDLLRKSNPVAALADLDRALWLRPQRSDLVDDRAAVLMRLRRYSEHARDIALLKEIDPIERLEPGDVKRAAQGLSYEAGQRRKAGDAADEVALLERAIALDPDDLDNHRRLDAALIRAGARDKIPAIWASTSPVIPRIPRATSSWPARSIIWGESATRSPRHRRRVGSASRRPSDRRGAGR